MAIPKPPFMGDVLFNGVVVGQALRTGDLQEDHKAARLVLDGLGLLKPISPARGAFNQAYSFAKTSSNLFVRMNQKPMDGAAIAPFVVNLAFSLEMYMKALCLSEGKTIRGHDLVSLFSALPKLSRQAFEQAAAQIAPQYKEVVPPLDIKRMMTDVKSAFVDWRYIHEQGHNQLMIKPQEMILMGHALHDACRQRGI